MTRTGRARSCFAALCVAAAVAVTARGEDLVFNSHTWTKFSTGFTEVRQTTPAGRYAFDASACNERYAGTAEITAPESVSGKIAGRDFIPDAPFTVTATFKVNYTTGPATPGSLISYRLTVETTDTNNHTQKCIRKGEITSVDAGTYTLTAGYDCSITTLDASAGATLQTMFELTTFNKTGICGYTIYSLTNFKVAPSSTNTLTGVVKRSYGGRTYWIPDAPVELVDAAGTVVAKTYLRTDPANTAKSWYRMTLPATFDSAKPYRLHVTLQSDPDASLAKLMLFASPASTKPLEIFSTPFTLAGGTQTRTKDMNIDRASGDIASAGAVTAEAAVETYWNVWREMYILLPFIDDRPLKFSLPLEVYLNAPSTFYCAGTAPPVCPATSAIVLQPRDSLPGADPSVLWHEFGHYVMSEIQGGPILLPPFRAEDTQRTYGYHNGFANSHSTLALDDGFATFWSWISNDILEFNHTPNLNYNRISDDGTRAIVDSGLSSEWNWATWDVRTTGTTSLDLPRGEEFAIAALLWDLYDKEADGEATTRATWTFGGSPRTPVDSISVAADKIMTIFRKRQPRTLVDLYNALKAELPAELTSLSGNPRNSGLSQLDELFVMQGGFADANGNWAYDYGETIGKPANSARWSGALASGAPIEVPPRPWRENVPPVPNSFVKLTLPATVPTATISYNFGPGLEKLSSSRQVSLTSGNLYLEMPSPHYPMEMIISVPGSAPVRLDNQVYWVIPRDRPLGSVTLSPTTTPAPTISSISPSSALTGASVTINGSNFSTNVYNNIVRFGGALGFVTEALPTRLVAVTPPIAAGSAPVTVEVNGTVTGPAAFMIMDSATCRYFVDLTGTSFTARGGTSRVFTYTKPACQWTIASQTSWITLDKPGSQIGNRATELTVQPNPTAQARTGTLSVNGTAFPVYQEAGEPPKHRAARH